LSFVLAHGTTAQDDKATVPLTTERHKVRHNPDHPTEAATDDRFHTDREGASLVLPTEQDAYSFVVYGDRTGGPKQGVDVLAQAVADTNLLEPDLVMTVGDLVEGYNTTPDWLKQKDQFKQIMDELICPWFPVAGNHDVYWRGPDKPEGEHDKNYEMHFGPLWYAFEHKGSFFIALYSDEGNPLTGEKNFNNPECQRMSDAQFDWLKKMLEKAKDAEHVFIFLHHPRWLGSVKRHVGYGNDWDKVHKELVKAGNVSAVFGGHIHHMRYDPADGIEYFSLATVGGQQQGHAPEAGWLHQFHVVTVRKGQVAFASIPVGGVDDPKLITGQVSEQGEVLGRAMPLKFAQPIKINDDGSVDSELKITLKNPATLAIQAELMPTSKDSRWIIGPDHQHVTVKAGEEVTLAFQVRRAAGKIDEDTRPIVVELSIDMLTEARRFAIPLKRVTVPGSTVTK